MGQITGIINLDKQVDHFDELSYFRIGAAIPFAARYRLIDFDLSNMVRAGVTDIAIFANRKYRTLMDHLAKPEAWDLDRKKGGIFILPPDWNDPTDFSKGDLRHFHNNLDFFHRSSGEYVLYTDGYHISNVDYNKVLHAHLQTNADMTVIYKRVEQDEEEYQTSYRLTIADDGRVTQFSLDTSNPNVFMTMVLLRKDLLLQIVAQSIAYGGDHFLRDGILHNVDKLRIHAYAHTGYLAVINSKNSYYKQSMRLLQADTYNQVFNQGRALYTKVKDEPPTRYLQSAQVKNSIIANGCIIEGTVENSILFRGVHIKKGASVKNSILMQRCIVGENASLDAVILDKDVQLLSANTLIGSPLRPYVVPKRQKL